jgi:hypothetical protein
MQTQQPFHAAFRSLDDTPHQPVVHRALPMEFNSRPAANYRVNAT